MKTPYVFPIALAAAATLFSTACQEKEKSDGPPKKGSSSVLPPQKKESESPGPKSDNKEAKETKIDHASAVKAAAIMKENPAIVIIDIRTPEEYATGHIPNSINIDFKADSFESELKKLDHDKTYLVHCRSGGRSTSSLDTFSKLGFSHIIHLDGGMMDWGKEQLPVEK